MSEQQRHETEITNLKNMIMSEFYIENRKSLIDTLVSHGGYARMAPLDIIDNLGDNHELKTYVIKKLETV
ncbi:MAG TPA: hypothetical protein VEL11_02625 [Candidatus Bathyarchaeia archaeon]|nr:hypothetical protein [Candidatus Bathyarchaeia archaeon]